MYLARVAVDWTSVRQTVVANLKPTQYTQLQRLCSGILTYSVLAVPQPLRGIAAA